MNVISLEKRLRRIEGQRRGGDAEFRAMTDDELIAVLRENGGTPEDEALIALVQGRASHADVSLFADMAGGFR